MAGSGSLRKTWMYARGIFWLCSIAHCQILLPYQPLPTTPYETSSDGEFTWPAGSTPIFDEGSPMNISWEVSYPVVNLYNIYQQNISLSAPVPYQSQLVTGVTGSWFQWTIKCYPDCNRPYSFRAINATGSEAEVLTGGIWSRLYWIRPSGSVSSSTDAASASKTSSVSSTSSKSTSGASAAIVTTASSNTSAPKSAGHSGDSSNGTAIGAGVGVGVGVVLILIGGFVLWRRYHKKMKKRYSQPGSNMTAHPIQPVGHPYSSHVPEADPNWKPQSSYHPFEAPSVQMDPHELPTSGFK